MGATKANSAPCANPSAVKCGVVLPLSGHLAQKLTRSRRNAHHKAQRVATFAPLARTERKPADRAGLRHWTPKELAGDLAAKFRDVSISERSIVRRCGLPAGHPGHIATNPAFPGRNYILETEVYRLLNGKGGAS